MNLPAANIQIPMGSSEARINPTRVLLADDHEVVRRGLRAILETSRSCLIVGEAVDGQDAVEKAVRLKPDVVILDISMPRMNGFDATRHIVQNRPETKVLILTVDDSESVAAEALGAGARGYLLKTDAARELPLAVAWLRQGKSYFTARVAGMVLKGFHGGKNGR